MFSILNSVIFFIVAVGVLITFHEYGHFWVARKLGVQVLRFSIGFGPAIYKWKTKSSDTEYVVAAIPLGGYVRMLDENNDDVAEHERPHAFNCQPLYKRSAIVAAGPLANFLLAALLYALVSIVGTEGIRPVVGEVEEGSLAQISGFQIGDELVAVDGDEIRSWDHQSFYLLDRIVAGDTVVYDIVSEDELSRSVTVDFSNLGELETPLKSVEEIMGFGAYLPPILPIIGDVVSDYPADLAGLQTGDRLLTVDGKPVEVWEDLVLAIRQSEQSTVAVIYERDGIVEHAILEPHILNVNGTQLRQIGITVDIRQQLTQSNAVVTVRYNPVEALFRGFETMWSTTSLTIRMLFDLIRFKQSADAIGGPVAIADYAGKAAQAGLTNYLTFLALLSISLGILNLLPIPVLDGGHLMFHLYEALKGAPPSPRTLMLANQVGIVLLIGIMGLAFYNDFSRIFEGVG